MALHRHKYHRNIKCIKMFFYTNFHFRQSFSSKARKIRFVILANKIVLQTSYNFWCRRIIENRHKKMLGKIFMAYLFAILVLFLNFLPFSTFLSKLILAQILDFFVIFSLQWKCKRINPEHICTDDSYG